MTHLPDHSIAYTDGASSRNPGPAGWGAILILSNGLVQELGGHEHKATNNRMEMLATLEAIRAWKIARGPAPSEKLEIRTDSTYVIQGLTQWGHAWARKGWPPELPNRELWMELWPHRDTVRLTHVRGHSGNAGNERADQIAVAFSQGKPVKLYSGPLSEYRFKVTASGTPIPKANQELRESEALYLSLVDGVIGRHSTWAECEAVVKGRSGARFKKVTSFAEEQETLKSWGVSS